LAVKRVAETGKLTTPLFALGAVIRGGNARNFGVLLLFGESLPVVLGAVSLEPNIPVAFGVLTVDSIEQAIERSRHQGPVIKAQKLPLQRLKWSACFKKLVRNEPTQKTLSRFNAPSRLPARKSRPSPKPVIAAAPGNGEQGLIPTPFSAKAQFLTLKPSYGR